MTNTEIRTLVVPLDASPLSEKALPLASGLARASGARLVLVSVPHVPGSHLATIPDFEIHMANAAYGDAADGLAVIAEKETQTYLERHRDALDKEGIDVVTYMSDLTPGRAIVSCAEKYDDSMIVMGTHGRSGLNRWLFGSVAEKVLHATQHPLLLVPARTEPTPSRIQKIILALDGSPSAERILPFVESIATSTGAALCLVHVQPDFGELVRGGAEALLQVEESYQSWLERYLSSLRRRLEERGLWVEASSPSSSSVVDTLLAENERKEADLIALTTHGSTGPGHWPMGSVANRLIRTSAHPVLVLRVQ